MLNRPVPTSGLVQETLRQSIVTLTDRLIASGMRYDAAPLYPRESVDALVEAGLHRTFAPRESGGGAFEDANAENAALLDVLRGMRATVSGSYELSGIDCAPISLLGPPDAYAMEPRFTSGAWRFIAVHLGGIEGLLAETRMGLSEAARTDPLQRLKFAEAVVAARTAYLWVREASKRAALESADAPAFVQMARGVVERAGLDVMELAARMIGTRSAFDGQRIDKIIRDLSLYLRQAGPDHARDQAAIAWLERDAWGDGDELW